MDRKYYLLLPKNLQRLDPVHYAFWSSPIAYYKDETRISPLNIERNKSYSDLRNIIV